MNLARGLDPSEMVPWWQTITWPDVILGVIVAVVACFLLWIIFVHDDRHDDRSDG